MDTALLAEVSYQEGLTDHLVHADTVGETLHQLGVDWKKAKRHIQSPDKHYQRKKKRRDWLKEQAQKQVDWWLVEEDESWFHRFVQPRAYGWSVHPLKLIQHAFKGSTPDKAVACFGALCQESQEILMDFAQGYPNSEQMWWVIVRLLRQAKQRGKKVMVLIWGNAPWHCSKRIREWIRTYNQQAKNVGEVRLLVHWLPTKSPWLNPIEPYWGHAKRRVCEPSGELSIAELRRRIRAQFKALTLDDLLQLSDPL